MTARFFKGFLVISILSPLVFSGSRTGQDELRVRAQSLFGRLPETMPSPENPITPEKVRLGRALFFEARISADKTVSCARCHPISLYGADGLEKSIGSGCQVNPRNAPTVYNAAGQISAHWIGNRRDVEDQARQSVLGPRSFGMPSNEAVENVLRSFEGYRILFREAFPEDKDPVRVENFAKAIGAFERTLVTPAPFDAFLDGGKTISDLQRKGLETFIEVGCADCHSGPFFGGQAYRKFGLVEPYASRTKSAKIDEGRYEMTKQEADKYVFKVSGLRNVAMTGPYFHDGSVARLEEAIGIMAKVQIGLDLAESRLAEIAVFLKSLTGTIPESALVAPLLPSANGPQPPGGRASL
jgi:cytochrome c peroxidase